MNCQSNPGKKLSLNEALFKSCLYTIKFIKDNAANLQVNLTVVFGNLANISEDNDILDILKSTPLEEANRLGDFGTYFKSVCKNYNDLATGIATRNTELSSIGLVRMQP